MNFWTIQIPPSQRLGQVEKLRHNPLFSFRWTGPTTITVVVAHRIRQSLQQGWRCFGLNKGLRPSEKTKQGIVKLWCSFFNLTESLWKWNLDSSEIHNSQSSILQSHPANSSGWNRFYGLVLMWIREVCLGELKWIMLGNVMGPSEYHINMVLLKLTYICWRWFNLIDNYSV